ncbi:hypothetical protein RJT34_03365 [Clitoria ternatea]|uniref:ENTH domain-containing protein n=1 Tax=Clitoria ternatea TaxID=43366 RepID=A0AAN9KJB1_CLITE
MTKLTHIIGIIKDKASQSKAAMLSRRTTLSLLRATSHDSFTPPTPKHLATLLSSGDGSRATASAAVEVLMDRLQGTSDAAVALKCLIAVHHIIHHGSFILQDQLSVYPSAGGRNYLNLSNFRHNSDPTSWELSSWVRWFARHIESLLCVSRSLGLFLGSSYDREERVSGLTNVELVGELESLVGLIEGICKRPDGSDNGNALVEEIVRLARGDWGVVEVEVEVRMNEVRERLGCFKFGEAVELVCCLKRLEEIHEFRFWGLVRDLKEKLGLGFHLYKDDPKRLKDTTNLRFSESDRFSGPSLLASRDFLRFNSARFL